MRKTYILTLLKYLLFSIIISTILELTIFNYNYYYSKFFKESPGAVTYSSNIKCNIANICNIITSEDEEDIDDSLEDKEKPKHAYVYLQNVNDKVFDLYLEINDFNQDQYDLPIFVKYEGSRSYYSLGIIKYIKNEESSYYAKIHSDNVVEKIAIRVDNLDTFVVDKIDINKTIPFNINKLRIILVFIISFLIFIYKPKSIFYNIKSDSKCKFGVSLCLIVIMVLFTYSYFTYSNDVQFTNLYIWDEIYPSLARNLLKGKVSLDIEPSEELLELSNPYDRQYREKILKYNKDYIQDAAFYNGKYYSYFGILPCIIFYVPLAIFEKVPSVVNVLIFLITAFFIVSFLLVDTIIKKFFKDVPLLWYIALSLFLCLTSGLYEIYYWPIMHHIPILTGLIFALLGIIFYIKSLDKTLNKKYILLGSICMALVMACRPQLILCTLLIVPFYYSHIKEIFKDYKKIIVLVLPYLIVGGLLMAYNYARFDNPFDFGATYNLTSNDMNSRVVSLRRQATGIYEFLFAPVNNTTSFPYLERKYISVPFNLYVESEKMAGGFFSLNIIALLSLLMLFMKKDFKDKRLYYFGVSLNAVALIIILLDIHIAGILPRYFEDFAFLFNINTIVTLLYIVTNKKANWKSLFLILLAFGIIVNLCAGIKTDVTKYTFDRLYAMKRAIEFWN